MLCKGLCKKKTENGERDGWIVDIWDVIIKNFSDD